MAPASRAHYVNPGPHRNEVRARREKAGKRERGGVVDCDPRTKFFNMTTNLGAVVQGAMYIVQGTLYMCT